jgi:Fe-S-cluster containining protein
MEPDVCSRCAAAGPTCCELTPGQEEQCFPLSEMERRRIVDHLGLDRGVFVSEANSGAFLANMRHLFPRERRVLEALFPETGRHLRLSTDAAGRCVFLRAGGCLLPRSARPYYCRLFPFWMTGGRLTAFVAAGCLVHRQGRTVQAMLALLDCTEAQVRDLHGRLRLAWGLPPKEGMPFVTPSL